MRKKWLAVVGALLVLAAGCGKGGQEPIPTAPTPTASLSPQQTSTPNPVWPHTYPLTGLGTDREVNQRPIVVMVENSPKARPQSGLDKADMVYEVLAEGEITRFVAVYQSQEAETIGPVRSLRPYFAEIAEGLDGVIVHAGWSQDAINLVNARKLDHFDQVYGDDKYYWRSNERKAPHNLYTSIAKIQQGMQDKKMRTEWKTVTPLFVKAEETAAAKGGDAGLSVANQVTIPYIHGYEVQYSYEAEKQLYLRTMAGEPHLDKETGEQLSASNLLIIETKHRILDSEGRRAVDVHGPGNGYLLQQGYGRSITWENQNGMIRAYADGKEVPLIPGQTWVQIVPDLGKVHFE